MKSSETDPDDMKNLDMISDEDEREMTETLHNCILSRDFSAARSLIENLNPDQRRRLTRGNNDLNIKPAIFVAIDSRRKNFVELLVNECYADIEEQFAFGLESCFASSPLKYAICRGEYAMFEFLLNSGADPTRLLKDRETSNNLCWIGIVSLKALQILSDHGADFNVIDGWGYTCLMRNIRSVDRCRILLDKGVDVNMKNKTNNTSLHLAVEGRCYETVKLLLDRGADLYSKNSDGYDPLQLACKEGLEEIVKIFLERVTDENRHIQSYQLLGACINDMTIAMSAWRTAVTIYSKIQSQTPPAKLNTPLGIAVEATSLSELDAISVNHDLFSIQSMVIYHKIFGPTHKLFFKSVASSATRFIELDLLDKLLEMLSFWIRVISDSCLTPTERCFQLDRLFTKLDFSKCNPIKRKVTLNISSGCEFIEACSQFLTECTEFKETETIEELILQFLLATCETDQKLEFQRFVRFVVKFVGQWCERTVLIDALNCWFRGRFRKTRLLTAVTAVLEALLECGADVNERDLDDNNVVHYLFERQGVKVDLLKEIAAKVIEYGIHLDARNWVGKTTAECLQELGIKSTPPINLMCIGATGIRKNKIAIRGILPKMLIDFVEMH